MPLQGYAHQLATANSSIPSRGRETRLGSLEAILVRSSAIVIVIVNAG